MKLVLKKATLALLMLPMVFACGKRANNNSSLTKAPASTAASANYRRVTYNENPIPGTDGSYRYLTTGTTPIFLKQEGTDKRIWFTITLALRTIGAKIKQDQYQLVYNEFLTCNDGSDIAGFRITHDTPTGKWSEVKGVVELDKLGTFTLDQVPKAPVTQKPGTPAIPPATPPASPTFTGQIKFTVSPGEGDILSKPWPVSYMGLSIPIDSLVNDSIKTWKKADAIDALNSKCKSATPQFTTPQ